MCLRCTRATDDATQVNPEISKWHPSAATMRGQSTNKRIENMQNLRKEKRKFSKKYSSPAPIPEPGILELSQDGLKNTLSEEPQLWEHCRLLQKPGGARNVCCEEVMWPNCLEEPEYQVQPSVYLGGNWGRAGRRKQKISCTA
ncbi:coiled-coil domain-containing protein 179 [Talpa occidentalis]|uniref:coiled-coil domain-containing protein 179 n=1 Tax=Talpa occidentalis TaxID=50954 RepID=UPI0023FA4478|nr:coiled-coil domain-containing protein 179 [Talpa occidentalis]